MYIHHRHFVVGDDDEYTNRSNKTLLFARNKPSETCRLTLCESIGPAQVQLVWLSVCVCVCIPFKNHANSHSRCTNRAYYVAYINPVVRDSHSHINAAIILFGGFIPFSVRDRRPAAHRSYVTHYSRRCTNTHSQTHRHVSVDGRTCPSASILFNRVDCDNR